MTRSGLAMIGALAALLVVAVLVWGNGADFVDTRPVCAGGPGDAQPRLHAECRTGPIPADWIVTHPSTTAVLVMVMMVVVAVVWLLGGRSRPRDIHQR